MGKDFEKQIKAIKDHGEKEIKAIQDQGKLKTIKKYDYDDEDTPFISKQKKIYNELVNETRKKIINLNEKVNKNDLIYRYKKSIAPNLDFNGFDNALDTIYKIRDGKIKLEDVKYKQEKFKSYLGEIKKETNRKSKKAPCLIFKCFIMQEMRLLNFMMIILQ